MAMYLSSFYRDITVLIDVQLSLTYTDNFSMTKDTQGNEAVFVEYPSHSGKFSISESTFASMKGLHFIGMQS